MLNVTLVFKYKKTMIKGAFRVVHYMRVLITKMFEKHCYRGLSRITQVNNFTRAILCVSSVPWGDLVF